MVTALDSLNPSDISRLKRLAEHGKDVYPTMCGIEMEGEFWGKRIDMRKLEKLELVERKNVPHGPALVPHFAVSAKGHQFLAAAPIRQPND